MIDPTQPDFTYCCDPNRRHDFVLLFDVAMGNPNGDPDADNMPRQDQETNHGIVTDVCLKRKVRNFVALTEDQGADSTRRIYVQDRGIYLNDLHREAHNAIGVPPAQAANPPVAQRNAAREWMCDHFYDVRMFGAVMGTKVNAGQVRGPMQMTFARSFDPILPTEVTVSRVALTDESEKKAAERVQTAPAEDGIEAERRGSTGTFGRKAVVPYGLYMGYGFYSAAFGKQTKVTEADLQIFWTALLQMWDHDHSASRGLMACRGLYVFSHDSSLGNAPAHTLFSRIKAERKPEVAFPRQFEDYIVDSDINGLPQAIKMTPLYAGR